MQKLANVTQNETFFTYGCSMPGAASWPERRNLGQIPKINCAFAHCGVRHIYICIEVESSWLFDLLGNKERCWFDLVTLHKRKLVHN